jgi:hypothetical protein
VPSSATVPVVLGRPLRCHDDRIARSEIPQDFNELLGDLRIYLRRRLASAGLVPRTSASANAPL